MAVIVCPAALRKAPPNKRLKLAARVDYGMNLSSARRSLSAIRYAAHDVRQNLWLVHEGELEG
jgi:hypothetical protein